MAITLRLPIPNPASYGPIASFARALQVDAEFLARFLAVCWELHRRGIPFKVGELRRSRARQEKLYAQGRTAPGPIVTYAKPDTSRHESGRAGHIEVAYKHRALLGELCEAAGLVWGGRWQSFGKDGDWQHLEYKP